MDATLKILFLVPYPIEGASYRYRVHQYLPFLDKENISYDIRPFISSQFYEIVYKRGAWPKKIMFVTGALLKRLRDLLSLRNYDLIFIHLETSPFPILWIEKMAKLIGKPIVFDFDDAIFLKRENAPHGLRSFLKSHEKPKKIIKLSSHVIVGNQFLKDYSTRFISSEKITILPTSVDPSQFHTKTIQNEIPVIGWIGSHTTFPYLESILDIFPILAQRHPFILKIIGSPQRVNIPNVPVIQNHWTLNEEMVDFASLDIGIYPLADTEWARGKAGFKTLQYMAAGIPCVVSAIGKNNEIVEQGVNGFLVKDKSDWIEKLDLLLKSPELRQKLLIEGQKTIEAHYSLEKNAPKFIEIVKKISTMVPHHV